MHIPFHTAKVPLRRLLAAFTLVELLVIIAVIAILAAVQLPALAKTKVNSQTASCFNNLKQLAMADLIYAGENRGYLAPNPDGAGAPTEYGTIALDPAWVAGNMASPSSNTNADLLVNPAYAPFGSLGIYTKNPAVYHCPADKTTGGGGALRVRSYSCNAYVAPRTTSGSFGQISYTSIFQSGTEIYLKDTSFNKLKPSECFVFTEERRVPIFGDTAALNDGWFWSPAPNAPFTVRDPPQIAHERAGTYFSFGDGHAELHQWTTAFFKTVPNGASQLGNPDVLWLASHSSAQ